MTQKKLATTILLFSVLIVLVLLYIDSQKKIWCLLSGNDWYCVGNINNVTEPIFLNLLSLVVVLPTLYFIRSEVFLAWKKFAVIAFPLMFGYILYIFQNSYSGGFMGINDENVYPFILAPLFVIISYIIIGVKSWKLRNK
jgi:hypothetical protein